MSSVTQGFSASQWVYSSCCVITLTGLPSGICCWRLGAARCPGSRACDPHEAASTGRPRPRKREVPPCSRRLGDTAHLPRALQSHPCSVPEGLPRHRPQLTLSGCVPHAFEAPPGIGKVTPLDSRWHFPESTVSPRVPCRMSGGVAGNSLLLPCVPLASRFWLDSQGVRELQGQGASRPGVQWADSLVRKQLACPC